MNLPDRNDRCPCGSGLKYKKCCLPKGNDSRNDPEGTQGILAQAYKNMGDEKWAEAISLFKEALDISRDRHSVLEAIAACYDGIEDYLPASEYYEKALACCPSARRLGLYYRLGVSRACAGRWQKAEDAFLQYLDILEDSEQKALILQVLKNLALVKEGKKNPSFFRVQVQLQRAFTDMEADRHEYALARLKKIAEIDPENSAIFYNLGVVYTFLKNEDKALENFQRCIDFDPEYAPAYYNMGQIHLLRKRDFSQALHFFDLATAVRPNYIGAHHQRGTAYGLLGNPQKAIECWKKTLQLDPGNNQARENIERVRDSTHTKPARKIDRKDFG